MYVQKYTAVQLYTMSAVIIHKDFREKNPLWGDDDESVAVSSFIIEIKPRKLPFNFPGCSLLSNSLN